MKNFQYKALVIFAKSILNEVIDYKIKTNVSIDYFFKAIDNFNKTIKVLDCKAIESDSIENFQKVVDYLESLERSFYSEKYNKYK